uniref:ZC3H15/TMA46 family C-terminal domain-containing protein n=1 Tax=Leptocylindrus danicus TaxID=163516 RepID=A0A7S2KI75_9STRA|mmetsp:Transcript_22347/g.33526  ORF Transcript_22347/g.33526 Transcript_22347/m.33526 type:complete len:284 (+) Transcript_22347:126-977(+)
MPSKSKKKDAQAASKKAEQKRKTKLVEDKTFGLKNKNKSKKVQDYVKSTTASVMGGGDRKKRVEEERKKQEKIARKAMKKAAEDERNALFNDALMATQKKTTTKLKGTSEAIGRDAASEANEKKGTSRAMKMMFQMDAKEMEDRLKEDPNYVRTLEDEVEAQRQKMFDDFKKSGKKGTPVTEETLKIWQDKKRKKRLEEAKKLVEAESRKKKGGKGLSVLSGRALYEYNKSLFKDDEAANDNETPESAVANKKVDSVDEVAEKVQSDLFLEGDDDDLDDLEDD